MESQEDVNKILSLLTTDPLALQRAAPALQEVEGANTTPQVKQVLERSRFRSKCLVLQHLLASLDILLINKQGCLAASDHSQPIRNQRPCNNRAPNNAS